MRKLFAIALALGLAMPVHALPDLKTVGEGNYRYLFWQLYDARLATVDGRFVDYEKSNPLLLELTYQRKISREQFIDSTIDELQKLRQSSAEQQQQWASQLKTLWQDVNKGDRLAALLLPDNSVEFYFNGQTVGVLADPAFGPAFFNIWFDANTSAPKLREQLTGFSTE